MIRSILPSRTQKRDGCHFSEPCGGRSVSVIDFLKVRDMEVTKGGGVYPYEEFALFLQNDKGTFKGNR